MITVENVTRTYGDFIAVDDVSFTAQPGRITGFLGSHGAGESTTLRVLVGLTLPQSGAARVLGRQFRDLPNPGLEVGVLLDASAQHAGRTGRERRGRPDRRSGPRVAARRGAGPGSRGPTYRLTARSRRTRAAGAEARRRHGLRSTRR